MHKPESVLENELHEILLFWNRNKSPNPGQKAQPRVNPPP